MTSMLNPFLPLLCLLCFDKVLLNQSGEPVITPKLHGRQPVWPDWAMYWTLGNFSKPLAAINLPKSPTFLCNFCKGVKTLNFSSEIIFGHLYRHLATFYWSHCRRPMCTQSTYLPTYRKITETSKNVLVINFCSSRGCPSLGKGHDCEGKGL